LLDDRGTLIDGQVSVQLETFGIALSTTGRVTRESASVADGQVGRILYAQLDAAPGFRPGDFVTVRVQEPELTDVARLPASALGGDNTVLVVSDDDRLQLAPVTLLRRQGNDVIIRAGDLAGRLVVAERAPQLGAGIKINPLQQGQEQAAAKPDMMELTAERRAALIAFVEGSSAMPQAAKERVLAQLNQDRVPSDMVERIESRMGG
ncbi:MAG: efflux transporter periplasmic adaptor subunit, partial [Pseudomonadota bacterium]|nr:efflux transporter periplasmic adaptor subunit [Pseudomonadota bacterium]